MTGFSKLPLALAVASAVFLSGCLGGGGGGSSSSGSPATTTTVEGTAAKGIVLGGVVKAYEFGSDTVVAETTTSLIDGTYKLPLPTTYKGGPLLIVVSANGDTKMRCDLVVCGEDAAGNVISFGADYAVADNFTLQAAIPGTTNSELEVNVTPLTSVAVDLAQERALRGIDAREAVSGANNQIALSFEIAGDLTALPVVDLTNLDSVAAAGTDSFRAVAAVQAMQQSGLTPEAALSELSKEVIRTDGNIAAAADPAKPGVLSLESVYKQALVLVEEIEAKAEKEQVDLGDSLSGAKTALKSAEKKASTGSTEPKPVEPKDPGSEGLQATKQFVQQLRDLTNTATLEENLQGFAEEVEMVSQVAGPDLKASLSAMGMALRAIAEAEEARQNGVTDTRFDFDGVVVNRTGKVYDVKQTLVVNGLDINVDIKADVTYENDIVDTESDPVAWDGRGVVNGEYTTKGNVKVEIAVAGTAASTGARVIVEQGSFIDAKGSIDVTGEWEDKWITSENDSFDYADEWGYADREQGTVLLSNIDTALIVKLEQLTTSSVPDPMTFTGKLNLDVDNFGLTWANSEVNAGEHYYWHETGSYEGHNQNAYDSVLGFEFSELGLTVSGEFSNSGSSLYAAASLQVDDAAFLETCYSRDDYEYGNAGDSWHYDDDCLLGENTMGNGHLALNFDLDLVGMNDPISVAVNARNQGLDAVIGDARLIYDGQSLQLDYAGANSITVKNHHDVLLTLKEVQVSGDEVLTGDIQWKGKKYATVDMELGAPRIRYPDGTFEVL